MKLSYRTAFQNRQMASEYEARFAPKTFEDIISRIEQDYLQRVLKTFSDMKEIQYLDFACGTARILSFMESHVGYARGIDIAAPMLELAKQKVKTAELLCRDITAQGEIVEAKYDLITSFRFFLNAEPTLREAVMGRLVARLKDGDSRLVFNVHGILNSHKALTWAFENGVSAFTKRPTKMRALTQQAVVALVEAAGLEVVDVYGYDLLSSKALAVLGFDRLQALELRFAGSMMAGLLGSHRIYVTRLRAT